ncbi:hypothetical protein RB195_016527 [Necator americanus]|uniref:Uncharacterized protein n=1 Tax=Necator americanus TaxID=51031 RepID=A0ABR1C0W3_NECAM
MMILIKEEETKKEETWAEDVDIQHRFTFAMEYGPHVDVQGYEMVIDYFRLFLNDQLDEQVWTSEDGEEEKRLDRNYRR